MFAKKKQDKVPPPKYTLGRLARDLASAAIAAGVAGVIWAGDRVNDCIN